MDPIAARYRAFREPFERLERYGPIGIGVVVHVHAPHIGLALVPIQLVDVKLRRLMDVDRVLVHQRLRGEYVDLADDSRPIARGIDDHDVFFRGRPQRYGRRREVVARPVPAHVAGLADVALLAQESQQWLGFRGPETFPRLEGQLETGSLQVTEQDMQVVRIETRFFRRRLEQEFGVGHHVSIDRPAAGDQH